MTFSHDGLRDSLTQLAAPPYFYENLKREISASHRSSSALSLIQFILGKEELPSEDLLLAFAHLLTTSFRYEDLTARIGENEFVVLIKGGDEIASVLATRLAGKWNSLNTQSVTTHYSCVTYLPKESALEFLNRLDRTELLNSPT